MSRCSDCGWENGIVCQPGIWCGFADTDAQLGQLKKELEGVDRRTLRKAFPRGICPGCGNSHARLPNGLFWTHNHPDTHFLCPGCCREGEEVTLEEMERFKMEDTKEPCCKNDHDKDGNCHVHPEKEELLARQIKAHDKPNNCLLGWCNAHQIVTLTEKPTRVASDPYCVPTNRTGFICQVTHVGLTFAEVVDDEQLRDPWNIPQQFLNWDVIARIAPCAEEEEKK